MFLSFHRCPVFRRLREEAEKRKRPSWNELKGRKGDGESSGDAKHSATLSPNPNRDHPEPGLINPAYEESEDGTKSFFFFISAAITTVVQSHKSVFCTTMIIRMKTS